MISTSFWFTLTRDQWSERLRRWPWYWAEQRRGELVDTKAVNVQGSKSFSWAVPSSFFFSLLRCPCAVQWVLVHSDGSPWGVLLDHIYRLVLWSMAHFSHQVWHGPDSIALFLYITHHSDPVLLYLRLGFLHCTSEEGWAGGAPEHWTLHLVQLPALRPELPTGTPCLRSCLHSGFLSCSWQPFQVLRVSLMLCEWWTGIPLPVPPCSTSLERFLCQEWRFPPPAPEQISPLGRASELEFSDLCGEIQDKFILLTVDCLVLFCLVWFSFLQNGVCVFVVAETQLS